MVSMNVLQHLNSYPVHPIYSMYSYIEASPGALSVAGCAALAEAFVSMYHIANH